MDSGLKQRLVGAVVLVALAVIFLPMLLDGSGAREHLNENIAIPDQPDAPESRLERDGAGPENGGAAGGDAPDATLATDDFSDGADTGEGSGDQAAAEPESGTEAGGDAPASGEEPATDAATDQGEETASGGATDAGPSEGWVVQVGSFQRETNAVVLRDRLREDGFDATAEQVETDGRTLWRVWLGPVTEREEGEALERRIEAHRGSDALLLEYSW